MFESKWGVRPSCYSRNIKDLRYESSDPNSDYNKRKKERREREGYETYDQQKQREQIEKERKEQLLIDRQKIIDNELYGKEPKTFWNKFINIFSHKFCLQKETRSLLRKLLPRTKIKNVGSYFNENKKDKSISEILTIHHIGNVKDKEELFTIYCDNGFFIRLNGGFKLTEKGFRVYYHNFHSISHDYYNEYEWI